MDERKVHSCYDLNSENANDFMAHFRRLAVGIVWLNPTRKSSIPTLRH